MLFLKTLGYQGLSMSALMPYLKGEKTGRVVGITFDDGYLNNLTNALPVLMRNGFSATCYCVSQRVGDVNAWDDANGIGQTQLMAPGHLRQWVASGQEVGAHTRHHVRLTQVDSVTAQTEIEESKNELEQVIGQPVQQFCYPYGEFSAVHVGMVRAAGYIAATTTRRGRVNLGQDFLQLNRVPVVRSTSLPAMWLKIATNYEDRKPL